MEMIRELKEKLERGTIPEVVNEESNRNNPRRTTEAD
jgi:hypothetical protein